MSEVREGADFDWELQELVVGNIEHFNGGHVDQLAGQVANPIVRQGKAPDGRKPKEEPGRQLFDFVVRHVEPYEHVQTVLGLLAVE